MRAAEFPLFAQKAREESPPRLIEPPLEPLCVWEPRIVWPIFPRHAANDLINSP